MNNFTERKNQRKLAEVRGWPRRFIISCAAGQPLSCMPRPGICRSVESRCCAVTVGLVCLFPPLSSGGARVTLPWFRFHIPLIEPDVQISRIRLSFRSSNLRFRKVVAAWQEAYQSLCFIKELVGVLAVPRSPLAASSHQPDSQASRRVVVD